MHIHTIYCTWVWNSPLYLSHIKSIIHVLYELIINGAAATSFREADKETQKKFDTKISTSKN